MVFADTPRLVFFIDIYWPVSFSCAAGYSPKPNGGKSHSALLVILASNELHRGCNSREAEATLIFYPRCVPVTLIR